METDEASSETTGDGKIPRLCEGNGNNVPDEATGIRPCNPVQGATNRGESVSVPSATPISASIDGRYKEVSSLYVDTKHEFAHLGLPGLTTDTKLDAKDEAAVQVKAAARSSAQTPGTRIVTCDEDTLNNVTQAAALRLPSPLHNSRYSLQPWSRLAKLPTSVSAAAQLAPGTSSATNKQLAINCGPEGDVGTACDCVSDGGICKNEPSALDGLLFAAAAAASAAGILRESSAAPSSLVAMDSKDLRVLHAATSPTSQSGEHPARPAATVHARPPRGSSAAVNRATGGGGSCGRGSGKLPCSSIAAALTAFATSDSETLAASWGLRSGQQLVGGTWRCSGGGGGEGDDASSRGHHLHHHHHQQLLPALQRQASKGNDEEGWRSRHHSKQMQLPPAPHVIGAGTISCGDGGTTRGTTSHHATTCGTANGSGATAAAAISAASTGAVRSKGVLSPKVPVIMPRQFAERIMDPSTILKYGITVVVRRIGPVPLAVSQPLPTSVNATAAAGSSDACRGRNGGGGSDVDGSDVAGGAGEASGNADLVLTAQVEQFFHAQGYSQYRVLGLKEISCGYHNWRIEMWEALGDRTVRLTICAPPQAVKAPAPLQLMFPQPAAAYRGPQEVTAATSDGGGGGSGKDGDTARGLQQGAAGREPADKEPQVKRDPGLECTEEVGEEDYDDDDGGGGGSASAAAAPLELEAGRGAHLLVAAAVAAAAGRSGRCKGGGSGSHEVAAGAGAGRRPRGGGISGGVYAGDGSGTMSVIGMKRGAEMEAEVEACPGSETEDPDTSATTRLGGGGGSDHKLLRTSTGAAAKAVRDPGGGGGGGKDDLGLLQGPGPEVARSIRGEHGRRRLWEGKARPVRRTGGGWRDTAAGSGAGGGGGSGAFGGYSSLPAEDMPQELPGALASSPHPCRKGGATVLSPDHFIHLPRLFFQDNFDTAAVLSGGLRVQVQAGNLLDPIITTVSVASYQNHTGYRYYRLLGFKDVPRRYVGWRVAAWDKVAADMVRVRLSPPLGMPLRVALARAGQLGAAGSSGGRPPQDAAAAVVIGIGVADTSANAAGGHRDGFGNDNGNCNAGCAEGLLPQQRRSRRAEAAPAAGGPRFNRPGAAAQECHSENEEDRAAGLAMMNLGWDLREKRLRQQEHTSPGTVAAVPVSGPEVNAVGIPGSREATAERSNFMAKLVAGTAGACADTGMGKGGTAAQQAMRRGGGRGSEAGVAGGKGSDMGSGDDGDVAGGIKRGVHRAEWAAGNATAAAGDGDDVGGDSDAGGSPAGGLPAARRRPAGVTADTCANSTLPYNLAASGREASLSHLLRKSGQGMAGASSSGVIRHVAPSTAEVRRIMEAGVAAAVARLEVPASRVRSVVSQNQSVVRPDKGRVYLQKPFVESSLAVTATPLSVQVVINSGGQLDPATYPTKVTLSSSGAHGKAEYLLRLTAPMKHAHSGQLIVGWSAMGRQLLLMHLAPAPAGAADLGQERARTLAGQMPAPPLRVRAGVVGMLAATVGCVAAGDYGGEQGAVVGNGVGQAVGAADGRTTGKGLGREAGTDVGGVGKGGSGGAGAAGDGLDGGDGSIPAKELPERSQRLQRMASYGIGQVGALAAEPFPGGVPSAPSRLVDVQGPAGTRPASASPHVAPTANGMPNLVVPGRQQGRTVRQSLPASADCETRLLAVGWPLVGAAVATQQHRDACGILDHTQRQPQAPQHQQGAEGSDGGGSPTCSLHLLTVVLKRRPRSSRLQRPRQGQWAHPNGPLQRLGPLPLQHYHSRHHRHYHHHPQGYHHERKPSLPDSVLNAAEQLLHLSGQVLCSGSNVDSGDGAAAGDGSGADEHVDEHVDMHRGCGEVVYGGGIHFKRDGGELIRGGTDGGEASSEGVLSGGKNGGELESARAKATSCVSDDQAEMGEEEALGLDNAIAQAVDGGGVRCGSSSGGGGGSGRRSCGNVRTDEVDARGAGEGRGATSPKRPQAQLESQLQQQLQLQLQRHLKRQQQQPQEIAADGDDDWAFRRRRAAVLAARRITVGGAPPSPSHTCIDGQQHLGSGEIFGGVIRDVNSARTSPQKTSADDTAAGSAARGPEAAGAHVLVPSADSDTAHAPSAALGQPPTVSASIALAMRGPSSATPYEPARPPSSTAPVTHGSRHQSSSQTPVAVASAAPTAPAQSHQLTLHLSPPSTRTSIELQQLQQLQHWLMGREAGRSEACFTAATAGALSALSKPGAAVSGAESSPRGCQPDAETKSAAGGDGGGNNTAVAAAAVFAAPLGHLAPMGAALRAALMGSSRDAEAAAAAAAAAAAGAQRVSLSRSSIDSSGGCGGMTGTMERPHPAAAATSPPHPSLPAQPPQQQPLGQTMPLADHLQEQEQQQQELKGMASLATALLGRVCGSTPVKTADSSAAPAAGAAATAAAVPSSSAGRTSSFELVADKSPLAAIIPTGTDAFSPKRHTTDTSVPPQGIGSSTGSKRNAAVALQEPADILPGRGDGDGGGDGDGSGGATAATRGLNGSRHRRFRPAFFTPASSDCPKKGEQSIVDRDTDRDVGVDLGGSERQCGGAAGESSCHDMDQGGKQGDLPSGLVVAGDRSCRSGRGPQQQQPSRGDLVDVAAGQTAGEVVPPAFRWPQPISIPMPMPLSMPIPLHPSAASALGMQMAALGYGLPVRTGPMYPQPQRPFLGHQQGGQQEPLWQQPWQQHWHQHLQHPRKLMHQHQMVQVRRRELQRAEKQRQQEQRRQHHVESSDEKGAQGIAGAAAAAREKTAAGTPSSCSSPQSRLLNLQQQHDLLLQQRQKQLLPAGSEAAALLGATSQQRTECLGRSPTSPNEREETRLGQRHQQHPQVEDKEHAPASPADRNTRGTGAKPNNSSQQLGPAQSPVPTAATMPPPPSASAADSVRAQLQALIGAGGAGFQFAGVPLMLLLAQQQQQQQQEQQEHCQHQQEERRQQQQKPYNEEQVVSELGNATEGSCDIAKPAHRGQLAHPQSQSQFPLSALGAHVAQAATAATARHSEPMAAAPSLGPDSSVAMGDAVAAGLYLHRLQQQLHIQRSLEQHQQQRRYRSQQQEQEPQEQQQQQIQPLDMPLGLQGMEVDTAASGANGSSGTEKTFHLDLAGMGPALQHLILQSRLRQQAADWTAAAAMAAAAMTQPRTGQSSGGPGAGAGLGTAGISFGVWGSGL